MFVINVQLLQWIFRFMVADTIVLGNRQELTSFPGVFWQMGNTGRVYDGPMVAAYKPHPTEW